MPPELKVVHAACPHDCPDACGVLISVDPSTGNAVNLRGDPKHPVTRGFLCAKVAQYLDRVYSPDRVLFPMKRIAAKGPGHGHFGDFERISWNEALATVAAKFKAIANEFGGEAILPYSYGGTLAVLNGGSMDRRFFHRLGASRLDRTICSAPGEAGIRSVYGVKLGTEPEQFAQSRYIIAWGANIHGNNVHLWPFIEEAKRSGARLIVIDPYKTKTARLADWHIAIRPGTDVALALGLMHVIINERLYDADYVARYTLGFDKLKEKVQEYTPQRVAEWTGIPANDIVKLAREYARTRPAAIRLNYGIQRSENGGSAVRAVCMLPCLVGAWKDVGGGLQLSLSGGYNLNRDAIQNEDLCPRLPSPGESQRLPRIINMVELAKALNEVNDPPVKALFVYNSNPAAVVPDHNAVIRGLKRDDLFTVVHEQFLTDTCDYADIVLPATTFFEHKDLQTAYGHYFLQMSDQAIEPLGECRSNVETFRALAGAMGFEDAVFDQSVDQMIDLTLTSGHPHLAGVTRAKLEAEGHVRLTLPVPMRAASARAGAGHAGMQNASSGARKEEEAYPPFKPFATGFPTPSGKAEFYSESLIAQGLDPVVTFVPPSESRHRENSAKSYPLELLGRKCDNYLNSTFSNLASIQKMENPNRLEIGRVDADARGISDGDRVRVFNSRGEIFLTASVDGKVPAGVVAASLNWAKLTPGGHNINVLTSDRLTDMGGGPTFYSVLVEVEKA